VLEELLESRTVPPSGLQMYPRPNVTLVSDILHPINFFTQLAFSVICPGVRVEIKLVASWLLLSNKSSVQFRWSYKIPWAAH